MTKGRAEDQFRRAMGDLVKNGGPLFLRNLLDLTHFGVAEPGCDFQLSLGTILIECKNTDRSGVLVDRPSDRQTKQLEDHGGFIFLGMWDEGYPALPKGADLYMIPWEAYKTEVIANQDIKGKSFRRHATARAIGADQAISPLYKCGYKRGSGAIIGNDNPFWLACEARSETALNAIKEMKIEHTEEAN